MREGSESLAREVLCSLNPREVLCTVRCIRVEVRYLNGALARLSVLLSTVDSCGCVKQAGAVGSCGKYGQLDL